MSDADCTPGREPRSVAASCDENYTTAELLDKADARLFRLAEGPEHCLHHLLPDTINSCPMDLRHRGHSFSLP